MSRKNHFMESKNSCHYYKIKSKSLEFDRNKIVCCRADRSYTVLIFIDGHKEIKPINLKKISELLPQ